MPRCILLLTCLAGGLSIHAQVTTGTILGAARDASGAVVPGVKITITNQRTNATREVTADERGDWAVPALLPSDYTVRAEATGFKAWLSQNLVLPVGGEVRVDIALQVGDVAEQVTVEARAPLIQSDSSSLAHVI